MAEFYSYNLIFSTYNCHDFERIMHLIDEELFETIILKDTLEFVKAIKNKNYFRYF